MPVSSRQRNLDLIMFISKVPNDQLICHILGGSLQEKAYAFGDSQTTDIPPKKPGIGGQAFNETHLISDSNSNAALSSALEHQDTGAETDEQVSLLLTSKSPML